MGEKDIFFNVLFHSKLYIWPGGIRCGVLFSAINVFFLECLSSWMEEFNLFIIIYVLIPW